MTLKDYVIYAAPMVVFALGSILFTYKGHALRNGWSVGPILAKSPVPAIMGFVISVAGLVQGYLVDWWHLGAAFVGGSILSMVLLNVFGRWSQFSLFLAPISFVIALIVMRPSFWT